MRCTNDAYVEDSNGNMATEEFLISMIDDYNIETRVGNDNLSFELFPNPSDNRISLKIMSESQGQIEIRIFDLTGRLISRNPDRKISLYYERTLNIAMLPSRLYRVAVVHDGKYITRKILKFLNTRL
jgi:hypothetical protein